MKVGTIVIKFHVPWVQSLKEKRMIVKSISGKIKNKFNVSVAEVDSQDLHKIIVIGMAYVTTDAAQADSLLNNILNFIEMNTEAEVLDVEYEIM